MLVSSATTTTTTTSQTESSAFFVETCGKFLNAILELWPKNTTDTNLSECYEKMLDHCPTLKSSDEEKLESYIIMNATLEYERRLQFIAVVINHFLFHYLDRLYAFSEEDVSDSYSQHNNSDSDSDEESRDSSDLNGGGGRGEEEDDSINSVNLYSTKLKGQKVTKIDRYPHAIRDLVLGQDKAALFLYPILSKTQKNLFNSPVLNNVIIDEFRTILKQNVDFLYSGQSPIEKNVQSDTGEELEKTNDHPVKKHKK